ncbi:MAG: DUF2157 domain-containing protein [Synergistaceae bacterium]|nr:DUF2157 domain-containing protein [Synergistaceae bacterium]
MPSAKIRKKEMDFLKSETSVWISEGIIDQEQSQEILSLYDVKTRNLRAIMLTAGAVLLGLGAVSFAMAHWHELDKLLRVMMIAGAYAASLTAYFLTGRSGTKTGKSFLLLSSAIFGGGIYLITRMYDIKLTFGEILGWWIVEVIAASVIARDEWQMYFAQALSLVWLHESESISVFALYFVRTARLAVAEFFAPYRAFCLIAGLWCSWFAVKDRAAFMMNMMLTLLLIASRMSLSFGGTWTLIILLITGALMSFLSKWPDTEIMGLLMLGVFGLLLTWPDFWRGEIFESGKSLYPVVNAVIVAALMLLNIWRGHSGIGITFCSLIAARYFFDHFFGFLPKAWGFTITGVIFVIAGIFFGKIRKLFEK